ncbi:MARS2_3 [Sanghuangporus sanghuang]
MQVNGWKNEDWIGRGLKYSAVQHEHIIQEQINLLLQIPAAFNTTRPRSGLSLKTILGRLGHVLQEGKMEEDEDTPGAREAEVEENERVPGGELLSPDLPNTGLEKLFEACILPSSKTVQEMHSEFYQQWLDGTAKSVVDWTDPNTRFPLAALTVYREFDRANDMRVCWRRAEKWMNRGKQTTELAAAVALTHKLLFVFEWDSELRAISSLAHSKELIDLLSNKWLSDSHIDMLLEVLTERANNNGICTDVLFAPCIFQQYILQAYDQRSSTNKRNIPLLEHYCQEFMAGRKQRLFFIAHINNNHWVPWKFDHSKGILGHGDSLETPESCMSRVKDSLQWWISGICEAGRNCTYKRNVMVHGTQTGDTSSCGIVSYNTIAHDLFRDELWTIKNSKRFRIEAFNSIILHHNSSRAKPRRELQVPPDSIKLEHAKLDPEQGQGLQIPLDSHRALGPSSSVPNDTMNESVVMVTDVEGFPQNGSQCPIENLSTATKPTPPSSQAQLSHDDEELTLVKKDSSSEAVCVNGKRERDISGHAVATAELERENGDEDGQQKKRKLVGKNATLATLLCGTNETKSGVHDQNQEDKDRQEATRGNVGTKHGTVESHEPFLGFSKSQLHTNKLRNAFVTGTLVFNESRYCSFKAKILSVDPNAQFDQDELKVLCSRCQSWKKMRAPYDVQNFKIHIRTCGSKMPVNTIQHYFKTAGEQKRLPNKPSSVDVVPCSGLTEYHDSRIRSYLLRPAALGGGGRSKPEIAKNRFGRTYSELDGDQKKEVDQLQESSWFWLISHRFNSVFSVLCKKHVTLRSSEIPEEVQKNTACGQCLNLLHNKNFRQALRVPEPPASKVKYINVVYQNTPLGKRLAQCKGVDGLFTSDDKQVRLAVRYAKGVVQGEFKEHVVFQGLVESVLLKLDRENKGKNLTNFRYPPAFAEFMSTVQLLSTRTHKLLSEHFPVPSARNLIKQRAKEPQFLPGISPRSFDLVDKFVSSLKVPMRIVALSADDTKLFPTFRTFQNRETEELYIVGGVGDPFLVGDPTSLHAELDKAQLKKATKVRIWVATVPLPKIPPIIIAAMAITDEITAAELTGYTIQIVNGLDERNIWAISYACDGTEKERANQRNLRVQAHSSDTRRVETPSFMVDETIINIPLFNGRPMALMQDSLHARKTLRNNLGTGTKTMVFGNHCALYRDIREMAFHEDSPLYHRDVERPDKQDDRAAARVYSSRAIEWLMKNKPEKTGTIIFLFVFGELIDAAQNRSIDMLERTQMVFRAKFFKEIWIKFLQESGYPLARHCLSREALDICTFQTDGFLELLFIYRDYMDDSRLPLLPWLHSSEPCEHLFAELRKQVKDFDFANFLNLVPKSHWLVRYSMGSGRISTADAKRRASGYAHTWFDTEGLSLPDLRIFPTDEQIANLAKAGFRDAVSLWEQLGVCVTEMRFSNRNQAKKATRRISDRVDQDDSSDYDIELSSQMKLPSLTELFPDLELQNRYASSLAIMPCPESIVDSKRAILEMIIEEDEEAYEKGPIRSENLDSGMLNISCAKLLLDLDTALRVEELHTPSAEEWTKFLDACARDVGNYIADGLPSLVDMGERLKAITDGTKVRLNMRRMLELRRAHETQLARKAVRTAATASLPKAPRTSDLRLSDDQEAEETNDDTCEAEAQDSSVRLALINSVLKLQQDIGIGTGLVRRTRWTSTQDKSGNAANAAAAASTRAATILSKRSRVYAKLPIRRETIQLLSNAGFNEIAPLREDQFSIVFHNGQLLIARVLSIYSKSGGQAGRHDYLREASNIGQISYLAVQTYEDAGNRCFREIHSALAHLSVASFAHLFSYEFLCTLPGSPIFEKGKNLIHLTPNSYGCWLDILRLSGFLPAVMKDLKNKNN